MVYHKEFDEMQIEIQHHCRQQFDVVGEVLVSYCELMQSEWSNLVEKTNSTLREYEGFASRHAIKPKEFTEGVVKFIDKRYREKQDITLITLDLLPVMEVVVTTAQYAWANGKTAREEHLTKLLYEILNADHEFCFKHLLANDINSTNSYQRLQYLSTLRSYYRQLGHQSTHSAAEVKILFQVDRKLSKIREDVAKLTATSKERLKVFNHSFKRAATDIIDLEKNYLYLNKLIEHYKKEGRQFKNIEEFTQIAENPPVELRQKYKPATTQKRTTQNWLEKAGVTAENFSFFYNSSVVKKLTVL